MTGDEKLWVRHLPVEHLEPGMFEPFGAVVGPETADSPHFNRSPGNMGFLWIQRALEFPKQPYLGALRYYYRGMRCEFLQKHPASTIVLIPLGGQASVIYVALDDGFDRPDLETARAILLEGRRGVILHPGTWVRYAYPLGPSVDFAYITQRVDPATANTTDDTVRYRLVEQLGLVLDVTHAPPADAELGPGGAVTGLSPKEPPYR
jgi:ureidoglycolate hydrolase